MEKVVKDLKSTPKGTKKVNGSTSEKSTPKVEKSSTKVDEMLRPSAESRIKKLQNFQLMADKHAFLQNKKDELEKFIISSDGTKEKITLSNAKGFNMDISNSQVVEEITEVVAKKLQTFLDASEKEILKYSI
jgi:hypothetical protein